MINCDGGGCSNNDWSMSGSGISSILLQVEEFLILGGLDTGGEDVKTCSAERGSVRHTSRVLFLGERENLVWAG